MAVDEVNLSEIRQSFENNRLDYLVGAGSSIDAGLPRWAELNRELLERFFKQDFSNEAQSTHLIVEPETDELSALASIFSKRFGREPVLGLIKSSLDDERAFRQLLRRSLYGDAGKIELKPLQYELAAALDINASSGPDRLVTTNYDNLLERAYCRLNGLKEEQLLEETQIVTSSRELQAADEAQPRFIHLHGYLPQSEDQRARGRLVLSESDFLETHEDWQTDFLRDQILERPERDLLIVGMSMADPRLRRLLHERADQPGERGKVFVLLPKSSASSDASLAVRRAHKLLGEYETRYWAELDVRVKFVENLDMLPLHLRKIRLGDRPDEWCADARSHLNDETGDTNQTPVLQRIYGELKQREASVLLKQQLRHFRSRFEVPRDEELTIGYFVPSPEDEPFIQLAFRFNDQMPGDYQYDPARSDRSPFQGVDEKRAADRKLRVATVEDAQGAAGYSFTTGAEVEALHSSPELNLNFDEEMLQSWDDGRTFSALLCVPVYGSSTWLPLGVGFLSSNKKQPFWGSISESDTLELYREIRTIFRELLEY